MIKNIDGIARNDEAFNHHLTQPLAQGPAKFACAIDFGKTLARGPWALMAADLQGAHSQSHSIVEYEWTPHWYPQV